MRGRDGELMFSTWMRIRPCGSNLLAHLGSTSVSSRLRCPFIMVSFADSLAISFSAISDAC